MGDVERDTGVKSDGYTVVIRLSALGDVVLTLPVLGPLAENTSTKIIFITREPYEGIVNRHPDVAAVYTISPRGGLNRGIKKTCERLSSEYEGKILLAVDLHRVPLSRYILSLTRAREKRGYRKYGLRRLALAVLGADLLPVPTTRVPELYAKALPNGHAAGPDYGFRLAVRRPVRERLLAEHELSAGFVAVFPGAVYPTKAWPDDKYISLIKSLKDAGVRAVIMGTSAENDLCARVAMAAAVPDLAGRVETAELPELLSAAAAVVGNDSAPGHLASLVGVPSITIFGPTSPRFGFLPWREGSRYYYADLPCSPCSRHGAAACWRKRRYCFDAVGTHEVTDGVLSIIQ